MEISSRAAALPVLKFSSFSPPSSRPFFSMYLKRFGKRPLSVEKTQERDIYFLVSQCANWASLKAGASLYERPPFGMFDSIPPFPEANLRHVHLSEMNVKTILWNELIELQYIGLATIRWWCERSDWHENDKYKVLLIDDGLHDENFVIMVLLRVIPSLTLTKARQLFHESRRKCFVVVTSTSEAEAELTVQAIMQCGLRSAIVPALSC